MELEKDVSREKRRRIGGGVEGRGESEKEQEDAGALILSGRPWTPH